MRKGATFILLLVGFALIATLYVITARTQRAGQEAARLERALAQERAAITVLSAEIAHLESPARLSALSEKYLELRPTDPEQIISLDDVIVRIPLRAAGVETGAEIGVGGEDD
ncbi:MAG: hypothetical protein V3U82_01070 [Robiginitomaculum sp.]